MYSTMCRMGRWSFWSWFDVNQSVFDMCKNDLYIFVHGDLNLWPLDLKFVPLVILVQRYVSTESEVSTAFLFREDWRTDRVQCIMRSPRDGCRINCSYCNAQFRYNSHFDCDQMHTNNIHSGNLQTLCNVIYSLTCCLVYPSKVSLLITFSRGWPKMDFTFSAIK